MSRCSGRLVEEQAGAVVLSDEQRQAASIGSPLYLRGSPTMIVPNRPVAVLLLIALPSCAGEADTGTGRSGAAAGADEGPHPAKGVNRPDDADMGSERSVTAEDSGGAGDSDPGIIRSDSPLAPDERDEACSEAPGFVSCATTKRQVYFDENLGQCEFYDAGECGTNSNAFNTAAACVAACGSPQPCGCLTVDAGCDPAECDACPGDFTTADSESCPMPGLTCRGDASHCDCIGGTGSSTWQCEVRFR